MDATMLHNILLHTFSTEEAHRQQAEQAIQQLHTVPGCLLLLLQIVSANDVRREVRQAASISLKNIVNKHWTVEESGDEDGVEAVHNGQKKDYFSAEEREAFKGKVLEALMIEQDKSVRDILAECINNVARSDFPDRWPSLIPSIVQNITSGEQLRMINSLLALRKVVKRYEFKPAEARGPLNMVVESTFPMLLELFKVCLSNNSVESAQIMRLICKIFWSSSQFVIPTAFLAQPILMGQWLQALNMLLAKRLPEASEGAEPAGQPIEVEERNAWPWWKAKKWVLQIFCRIFSRYGNPKYVEADQKEFSRFFAENVACALLETVMTQLALRKNGQFITDRVLQLSLVFVTSAIELSRTYKLLKPHLEFLLFEVVHPVLCLKKEDIELWSEDPHEFVRKSHDIMEDFFDPRMAATTLLSELAKLRGRDCMAKLLNFYTGLLRTYAESPPAQRDFIAKDGCLSGIGHIANVLQKNKYKNSLEGLIMEHVVPEFDNPHGFLRSRACWMFQRFEDIRFNDENHLTIVAQKVIKALQDPELPVRIEAAKTMRDLVNYEYSPTVLNIVGPLLPQILEQYFQLMNEIGNDEVVAALETIIDRFGDSIAPYAVQLAEKLAQAFMTFASAGEEDDESAIAAVQAMDAVNTVLQSVHELPELYPAIEAQLMPVMKLTLSAEGDYVEYLESVLEMLSYLTYYGPSISAEVWSLFPMVYHAFNNWAYDFMENMVISFDNFISKGTQVFLTGGAEVEGKRLSYLEMVFDMIKKVITAEDAADCDSVKACHLCFSLLHNCKGGIDECLPLLLEMVVKKLLDATTPRVQVMLLQVIASALYYNAQLTLNILERMGQTGTVLEIWMKKMDNFQSVLAKKLVVLGLGAVLQLPASQLPPLVRNGLSHVLSQAIIMAKKMAVQEKNEENEEEEEESEEEDSGDEEGFGEDEDVENDEDEEYLKALERMSKEANEQAKFFSEVGEWDEDDDDYSSPLDEVDAVAYILDTVQGASNREPDVYQLLQKSLSAASQSDYQELVTIRASKAQASTSS